MRVLLQHRHLHPATPASVTPTITSTRPQNTPSCWHVSSSNTGTPTPFPLLFVTKSRIPSTASATHLILSEDGFSSAVLHPRHKKPHPGHRLKQCFILELSPPPALLTRVCPDVLLQIPRSFEGFATHIFWALVWFLTSMCSHVALQPIPCPEKKLQFYNEKEIIQQAVYHPSAHAALNVCPVSAKLKGMKYPNSLPPPLTTQLLRVTAFACP